MALETDPKVLKSPRDLEEGFEAVQEEEGPSRAVSQQ